VVAPEPGPLGGRNRAAIDTEHVARADADGGRTQHRAVQHHPAGRDQPLDLAARGDAGARQRLGHALAGGLTVRVGGGWVGGMIDHDFSTMRIALAEAQAAAREGETPVGAVVRDPATGAILAQAHNRPIGLSDPTAHAEILALRATAAALGNYRLTGLELFVTLEPCAMCAGAISHARIGRLVFAAPDEKGGGVVHGAKIFDQPTCHWRPQVEGGLLAEESARLVRGFFQARRGR